MQEAVLVFLIVTVGFGLFLLIRFIRTLERIADALEIIARKPGRGDVS
ncbi:MAG: hypothetical protein O2960_12245 [Verrucomicrobia bacterium]|nr:hypothetical protein [Verrucomicrobiota bacterium]